MAGHVKYVLNVVLQFSVARSSSRYVTRAARVMRSVTVFGLYLPSIFGSATVNAGSLTAHVSAVMQVVGWTDTACVLLNRLHKCHTKY
jgi:hypothetical protein